MRLFSSKLSATLLVLVSLTLLTLGLGCQTATNTNTNTGRVDTSPSPNASPGTSSSPGTGIEAREPEKYQAKLSLSAQTTGEGQGISIPALTANVARSGTDRRVSFVIPGGDEVVYLDRSDKRYIILPKRKQYAELTQASTGFEVPRMMTPAQIVDQLKTMKGYERVGEETVNGRSAIKYRYAGSSATGTKAGTVQTEAIVLVDKDTGLPLRTETVSESESGSVKGVKGLKIVTEMTDIKTDAEATIFEVPAGFSKVSDQQMRRSVDAVGQAVISIIGQIIQSANNASATPAASVSPSPAR